MGWFKTVLRSVALFATLPASVFINESLIIRSSTGFVLKGRETAPALSHGTLRRGNNVAITAWHGLHLPLLCIISKFRVRNAMSAFPKITLPRKEGSFVYGANKWKVVIQCYVLSPMVVTLAVRCICRSNDRAEFIFKS